MEEVVKPGVYFWLGDHAVAEGALAAGCRFFAGYPITPSTETAERMAERLPQVGGKFIQMEDELASLAAVIGASCGGLKAMTTTSGPGFSLMMEHIGLAAMLEVPCVIANVMRGGPSTGLPTLVGQQDVLQARWGSHGDYEIIALCPSSCQESFDLTIEAFNLSERYRVPVILLTDEIIGHMTEKVVVPPASEIKVVQREWYTGPSPYYPYRWDNDGIAPMAPPGKGYYFHMTGLTHDERGYPVITAEAQEKLIRHLVEKIRKNAKKIYRYEEKFLEDAEIAVVSYGISGRTALRAVIEARQEGIRAGFLRLITLWPFPDERIYDLARQVKAFVVPEINAGQVIREVQRAAKKDMPFVGVNRMGGSIIQPEEVLEAVRQCSRELSTT
ncbi:MAG: 2-oxoacid:acceptor oxidoreductase subunit alpha [bacterium JZ-2024 1]